MQRNWFLGMITIVVGIGLSACRQQVVHETGAVLLSAPTHTASCVFLTTDEKQHPVVSWVETDSADGKYFYAAVWDSTTQLFSAPISIPIAPNTSTNEEGMPKIAIKGDGTWIATYETSVPSETSRFGRSDIQYTVSSDQGKTWTAAQSVQSKTAGSSSFSNVIRLDDGEIGIAWLGTNAEHAMAGRPVQFAKTNPEGGFDEAILIESFACQCCRTAISSNGQGGVNVVFRDLMMNSVRDIAVSTSNDNGQRFNPAVPFSQDNWVIEGCPHNGPSVMSRGDKTYVAWFTGSAKKGVFYAELDSNNHMLLKRQLDAAGRFAQICLMPDGTRVVAFSKGIDQEGDVRSAIWVNKIDSNGFFEKEVTRSAHASYPVVVPVGDRQVIVGWSDAGKVYYQQVAVDAMEPK